MMTEHNLVDAWRLQHDKVKKFTYKQATPRKQARLDFFLVSEDVLDQISSTDILSGYRTDHSLISLDFKLSSFSRGNGIWKFNSLLLIDQDYVKTVKQVIKDTIEQYAALPYDRSHLSSMHPADIQFQISDRLFLEMILMNIKR